MLTARNNVICEASSRAKGRQAEQTHWYGVRDMDLPFAKCQPTLWKPYMPCTSHRSSLLERDKLPSTHKTRNKHSSELSPRQAGASGNSTE